LLNKSTKLINELFDNYVSNYLASYGSSYLTLVPNIAKHCQQRSCTSIVKAECRHTFTVSHCGIQSWPIGWSQQTTDTWTVRNFVVPMALVTVNGQLRTGSKAIRTLHIQWDNFMAYEDNKEDLACSVAHCLSNWYQKPHQTRHRHFHYRVGISFYTISCQKIWIKAGTAKKRTFIPVHDIVQHLQMDRRVSKLLSGLHALTGSDTTSYLAGHIKTWWVMFKEHHYLLQRLGDGPTLCTKTVHNAGIYGSVAAYSMCKVDQICSSKACQWTSSLQLKMLFVSHQLFSLPSNP